MHTKYSISGTPTGRYSRPRIALVQGQAILKSTCLPWHVGPCAHARQEARAFDAMGLGNDFSGADRTLTSCILGRSARGTRRIEHHTPPTAAPQATGITSPDNPRRREALHHNIMASGVNQSPRRRATRPWSNPVRPDLTPRDPRATRLDPHGRSPSTMGTAPPKGIPCTLEMPRAVAGSATHPRLCSFEPPPRYNKSPLHGGGTV